MNNYNNTKRVPLSEGYTAVMGMGKTGVACVRFLAKQGESVCVMDSRPTPPGLTILAEECPHIPRTVGGFSAQQLAAANEIVISPGVSVRDPALAPAIARGVPIISEIELFARHANAPIVAITGSNGKSTVTTLVGEMAKQAGWRAQVGGNLGTPALELFCYPPPDLYVLELSSFQLETTYSLNPKAAVVLNVSEDHMDRYAHFKDYVAAKQSVYRGDGVMIINADDPQVVAMIEPHRSHLSFSLHCHRGNFSVCQYNGESYLVHNQDHRLRVLLPTSAIRLRGAVMRTNVLAALALGKAIGLPMSAMLDVIQDFPGLPHRCAWVANHREVDWFDDSKGTNVGATIAAIQGLEKPGQVILIAGGDGKGANFKALAETAEQHLRACVLIGRDAPRIAEVLAGKIPLYYANSMQSAVTTAAQLAQAGDAVLLSPACASFDMFKDYHHRGQVFVEAVTQLNP